MKSRYSGWRTVDVARASGYSVQQIRKLEAEGVIPPAERTDSGYRVYHEIHARTANTYRTVAAGLGPVAAKELLRFSRRATAAELLARLDGAHAELHTERVELEQAKRAAAAIAAEPIGEVRAGDALSISELAGALGIRPSTLRHWEAEGLLVPRRDARRARSYPPESVRDARIVHQLRLAGYRIETLRILLPRLRSGRDWDDVRRALAAREAGLTDRSHALVLGGAALLDAASGQALWPSTPPNLYAIRI
ncbi:MAG: MerR family transcriptional regulator [Stackebrandtia sp.]